MEHLESLGPHEKGKIYKLQSQRGEKFHANKIENNFNKNNRRKYLKLKKRGVCSDTRGSQNTKNTELEKEPLTHILLKIPKYMGRRKYIKTCKKEGLDHL